MLSVCVTCASRDCPKCMVFFSDRVGVFYDGTCDGFVRSGECFFSFPPVSGCESLKYIDCLFCAC